MRVPEVEVVVASALMGIPHEVEAERVRSKEDEPGVLIVEVAGKKYEIEIREV